MHSVGLVIRNHCLPGGFQANSIVRSAHSGKHTKHTFINRQSRRLPWAMWQTRAVPGQANVANSGRALESTGYNFHPLLMGRQAGGRHNKLCRLSCQTWCIVVGEVSVVSWEVMGGRVWLLCRHKTYITYFFFQMGPGGGGGVGGGANTPD